MKKIFFFFLLGLLLFVTNLNPADAGRRPGYFFDCGQDVHDRVYLQSHQNVYDSDWSDYWSPLDWADSSEGAQAVIDNFYAKNVLADQYIDNGAPILEVGQTFLEMSGQEQRRVIKFVAFAFGINGAMQVQLDRKDTPIGLYSDGKVQLY